MLYCLGAMYWTLFLMPASPANLGIRWFLFITTLVLAGVGAFMLFRAIRPARAWKERARDRDPGHRSDTAD